MSTIKSLMPLTCARPALAWDTATLSMQNRIIQKKLNLINHIKSLDNESLAKLVFNEQRKYGYPGLVTETQKICQSLGIPDITDEKKRDMKKRQWKEKIKKVVEKKNETELKDKIKDLEKLVIMKDESYEQKSYLAQMSLKDARMMFRIRTRTIKCKMNQSSSRTNKEALWQCSGCGCIDTQSHIIHCSAYQNLREGKSINNDDDLVEYFTQVMKIRDEMDLN